MKKELFNWVVIFLIWGCFLPEREVVSLIRIENNTGFYLDSLLLEKHSFNDLPDGNFTDYVEVIDKDYGIAAKVFHEGEWKPTDADDILGLEKLKSKKYTLQVYTSPNYEDEYIPIFDRLIEDD